PLERVQPIASQPVLSVGEELYVPVEIPAAIRLNARDGRLEQPASMFPDEEQRPRENPVADPAVPARPERPGRANERPRADAPASPEPAGEAPGRVARAEERGRKPELREDPATQVEVLDPLIPIDVARRNEVVRDVLVADEDVAEIAAFRQHVPPPPRHQP